MGVGLESKLKDTVKGEEHDEEHKKAKKLVDSLKYIKEIGATSDLRVSEIYTSPHEVTRYLDFLNRVRQQQGAPP